MSIFKKESLERAVEKVVAAMINREIYPDTLPVYRSDQSPATDKFEGIIVRASRESDPLVIEEGDVRKSTLAFEVAVELRSLIPADKEEEADTAWNDIEAAMRSLDPYLLPLDRFSVFHTMAEASSEVEAEEEGRKTRTRTYKIAVEEAVG